MAVRHWSYGLTAHSTALDVDRSLFEKDDPRRRGTPFRSAMSMLTFHINRAGQELDDQQRMVLELAKDELRKAFGKEPARSKAS